jgi:hypothetical protein
MSTPSTDSTVAALQAVADLGSDLSPKAAAAVALTVVTGQASALLSDHRQHRNQKMKKHAHTPNVERGAEELGFPALVTNIRPASILVAGDERLLPSAHPYLCVTYAKAVKWPWSSFKLPCPFSAGRLFSESLVFETRMPI